MEQAAQSSRRRTQIPLRPQPGSLPALSSPVALLTELQTSDSSTFPLFLFCCPRTSSRTPRDVPVSSLRPRWAVAVSQTFRAHEPCPALGAGGGVLRAVTGGDFAHQV